MHEARRISEKYSLREELPSLDRSKEGNAEQNKSLLRELERAQVEVRVTKLTKKVYNGPHARQIRESRQESDELEGKLWP